MNQLIQIAARGLRVTLVTLALAAVSIAGTLGGSLTGYYTILPESFATTDIPGLQYGYVQNTLGPDGLPVVTPFGAQFGGGGGQITDTNGLGEILWWTPGQNGVLFEKTQTDAMPLNFPNNFFPDGQGSDANGFRAVKWTGSFTAPSAGTINLTLGADDDAWVFIDGNLVVDNGGVKALGPITTGVSGLSAGSHDISIFYADLHQVQAGIDFSADVAFAPAVPEPASFALVGLGLLAAGLVGRKRLSKR